ncbi:hypothetical protein ACMA1D_21270 [Streptomyces sp. 796.1]|uniref:hypothetical protein n=1 Tax=Streptomyces sp. 796.1 TaxID=3163029 RepID=UPI0039C93E4A
MRYAIAEAVTTYLSETGTDIGADSGAGPGMGHLPRYSLSGGYVAAGPYGNAQEREKHARATSGSCDWPWFDGDEMRFDARSGLLTSLLLAVPEEPPADAQDSAAWLSVPARPGGLAITPGTNFDLNRAESRWWDDAVTVLVCLYPGRPARPQRRVRLAVAPGLSLLWGDERLAGWMLEDPARHLVHDWEPAVTAETTPRTRALLGDYLSLLSPPWIEAMEEGDPGVLARLEGLRQAISDSGSDAQRTDVLGRAVGDLMEHWYDL